MVAQGVGRAGVDKRLAILAAAIRAGMTADDLAELELAYAPPYGSPKDPVNMLGFVAQNVLDGTMPQWQAQDPDDAVEHTLVLDVRSRSESIEGHLNGALNIPHLELRQRLDEGSTAAHGERALRQRRPFLPRHPNAAQRGVRRPQLRRMAHPQGRPPQHLIPRHPEANCIRGVWVRIAAPPEACALDMTPRCFKPPTLRAPERDCGASRRTTTTGTIFAHWPVWSSRPVRP